MRLFFAVLLPDEMITAVQTAQDQIKARAGESDIRWTQPEQFHYTLKFLGEQAAPKARAAVEVAQVVAARTAPFTLTLAGAGAFPSSDRPSTLWIGASDGAEEMSRLAAELDKGLVGQGMPREKRAMKAHLTLARIKTYKGEAAAARALRNVEIGEIGSITVDRFCLMQSDLRPTGSVYTVVEEFGFVS
jgi:RNA 2',3'-cyclic 3'-phosphodiesterase